MLCYRVTSFVGSPRRHNIDLPVPVFVCFLSKPEYSKGSIRKYQAVCSSDLMCVFFLPKGSAGVVDELGLAGESLWAGDRCQRWGVKECVVSYVNVDGLCLMQSSGATVGQHASGARQTTRYNSGPEHSAAQMVPANQGKYDKTRLERRMYLVGMRRRAHACAFWGYGHHRSDFDTKKNQQHEDPTRASAMKDSQRDMYPARVTMIQKFKNSKFKTTLQLLQTCCRLYILHTHA